MLNLYRIIIMSALWGSYHKFWKDIFHMDDLRPRLLSKGEKFIISIQDSGATQ